MKKYILEKKIQENFSVIIPSKKIDKYLIRCIKKIKSFYPKIEIILMLDHIDNNKEINTYNNIVILKSKKKNIAFKRNFAAKKTKKKI